MPIQTQQQLIARSEEIRTATEQYSITEQQVGQLLIDIIETAFDNIPDDLTPDEIKALLLQNADTNILTDALLEKLNNLPANTITALAGKENTGVAQTLIDGLKDGVSFSGDTLNKLYNLIGGVSTGLNTKVSTGDIRLSDQRTPINNSVSTDKIQNAAVTEVKLSSEVRDKLNQVSGATGYDSNSFDADFAGKTTDNLQQGFGNLYLTQAEKNKLAGIESGATRDQTATEIASLYEGLSNTNKYTDTDKSKVDNVPANTNVILSLKENTGVAQNLIDDLKDNVSTNGNTLNKLYNLVSGKENVGVAQSLIDGLKDRVNFSGNSLNKLYTLISGNTVGLNTKVSNGDTRLTNERTPVDDSVTTIKIQDEAITAAKIALSGITMNRLASTIQDTLNSVANKENVGVAQGLVDDLKDGAPASGDTLNKINIVVNDKVSLSDPRLTDERTPLSGSVTTEKIQDGAVTNDKIANGTIEEAKLSSDVRDKLNQVSGATGYDTTSFNADFSGKTTDDLNQGVTNLFLTDNSVNADKIQDGVIGKAKLVSTLQDEINSISAKTSYTSTTFNADFSGKTSDNLQEGSTNLYVTDTEKTKLANIPADTISELAGKASTGDSRFSDERIPVGGSVSTEKIQDGAVTNDKIALSGITINRLENSIQDTINSVALKENTGVAQSLINALKDNVPASGNTLNKLNTLINQNTETITGKADTNDPRFTDERTPIDDSVSTVKIQDSAVTEIKLSTDVRDKLNSPAFTNILDGGDAYSTGDDIVIDGGNAYS